MIICSTNYCIFWLYTATLYLLDFPRKHGEFKHIGHCHSHVCFYCQSLQNLHLYISFKSKCFVIVVALYFFSSVFSPSPFCQILRQYHVNMSQKPGLLLSHVEKNSQHESISVLEVMQFGASIHVLGLNVPQDLFCFHFCFSRVSWQPYWNQRQHV